MTSHAEGIKNPKIFIKHKFLYGNILKISINSEDFTQEVLGISFDLNYSKDNLNFLRYSSGNFLEKGGEPIYLVENIPDENKIIFGQTLKRTDDFPNGGGKIVDFYFQIINKEKFNFKFKHGVVSTFDINRQDLENVIFENIQINKLTNESKNNFEQNNIKEIDFKNNESKNNQKFLFLCLIVGLIFYFILKRYNGKE